MSHAKDFNELEVTEQHVKKLNSYVTASNLYQAYKKCSTVFKEIATRAKYLRNDLFIAEDLFNKAIEHDPGLL